MSYKLEFKLKQHTPLIHFHNQEGATLRATELKPKLDKFLISYFNDHNIEYTDWLINGREKAFDYKVRIINPMINAVKGEIAIINDNQKWVCVDHVDIKIFSFHEELCRKIENLKYQFFALNNFGKRQNKGWGCFYPADKDLRHFRNTLLQCGKNIYYKNGNFKNEKNDSFYSTIIGDWQILKSGKNHKGYIKSKLFKFMSQQGVRWEKRLIKQKIKERLESEAYPQIAYALKADYDPIDGTNDEFGCEDDGSYYNSWENNTDFNGDFHFVRALLGLAEHYEFLTVNNKYKYQVKVTSKDGIERFKSPVTFKVFESSIFAIEEKIPIGFYGSSFELSLKLLDSGNRVIATDDENDRLVDNITIPPSFSLDLFLEEYFNCVNYTKLGTY